MRLSCIVEILKSPNGARRASYETRGAPIANDGRYIHSLLLGFIAFKPAYEFLSKG